MKVGRALFVCLFLVLGGAFGEKLGELSEILMPQIVKVDGNELFVVEDHFIFIYSLEDLSLKKKLGKAGQGPGEFNLDPSRTIVMSVFPEYLMAESRFKIIWYSRDGEYLKELKKHPNVLQTLPVGDNFAVLKLTFEDDGKLFFSVNLFDQDFKDVVELYRQKFFQYENKVFVMPDPLHFTVVDDKIFVEESPNGYLIEVFDKTGKSIEKIKTEYACLDVLDGHKEEAFSDYLDIPFFKRMIDENGKAAFDSYIKQQNFVYPETFPAIKEMAYDDGKLYVKTYEKDSGKELYYVHDMTGKVTQKIRMPEVQKMPFLVRVQGDKKYYTFNDGMFYYLKHIDLDDEEEIWEVHAVKAG